MVPEKAHDVKGMTFPMGAADAKSARMLARSFYLELRKEGFDHNQILSASNEILDLVAQDLRARASTDRAHG